MLDYLRPHVDLYKVDLKSFRDTAYRSLGGKLDHVLDTIGHNLANAATPGYSRQHVQLSAGVPLRVGGLLIGSGVNADQVQRSVDALLGRRIMSQRGVMGGLHSRLGGLSELEALFRIFSFIVLGILMLAVSFAYSRYREEIRRLL